MNSHPTARIPFFLLSAACLIVLHFASATVHAADKKAPPPAKSASQYVAFETHPNEHVTIAAEPCDDPRDCDFFRLPYIQHGFLPIRVIVTNDSDAALSLDDVRIQFISANNDTIPAANDDDIQRRLFSTKAVHGRQIPLPMPLPPITLHDKGPDKKIAQDDADFGFTTTTVAPHTTLAGYLLYDVRQLDDPALKGAELYVKRINTLPPSSPPTPKTPANTTSPATSATQQDSASKAGKGDASPKPSTPQQLFPFTIPFDKWLAAHPRETLTSSH